MEQYTHGPMHFKKPVANNQKKFKRAKWNKSGFEYMSIIHSFLTMLLTP